MARVSRMRSEPNPRASGITRAGGMNVGDRVFQGATTLLAGVGPALVALLFLLLFIDGWPALRSQGLAFVTTTEWDPVFAKFGAAHYIYGTLVTSLLALLLATPIAVGAALFLAEYAPRWLREPASYLIEMLAVVPSIIYGL